MSIFAWKMLEHTKPLDYPGTQYVCGLLASSPDDFGDSGHVRSIPGTSNNEFSLSNKGIRSHAMCRNSKVQLGGSALSLGFVFRPESLATPNPGGHTMSIWITKCDFDQFLRQDPWSLLAGISFPSEAQTKPQTEYFLSEFSDMSERDSEGTRYCRKAPFLAARRHSVLQLQLLVPTGASIVHVDGWPHDRWDEEEHLFFVRSTSDWRQCGAKFAVAWDDRITIHYRLLTNKYWASNSNDKLLAPGARDFFRFTVFDANVFDMPSPRSPGQADWEFEEEISDWIMKFNVPRATHVVTVIPGTGLVAVLSVKYSHVVEDEDVCMNPFRRLQMSFEVMKVEKAPIPLHLEWDFI